MTKYGCLTRLIYVWNPRCCAKNVMNINELKLKIESQPLSASVDMGIPGIEQGDDVTNNRQT